jgi:hypothetical protein
LATTESGAPAVPEGIAHRRPLHRQGQKCQAATGAPKRPKVPTPRLYGG